MSQFEQINEFWTGGRFVKPTSFRNHQRAWYRRSDDTDATIRQRFGKAHQAAQAGKLDEWQEHVEGSVALIILLDQFTRNLYRGNAEAYRNDHRAQQSAALSLQRHRDVLKVPELIVLTHPLHHAENLELQTRAVELMHELLAEVEPEWHAIVSSNLNSVRAHQEIIARFDRFPHRNQLLGRTSSNAEKRYLEHDNRNYGQN